MILRENMLHSEPFLKAVWNILRKIEIFKKKNKYRWEKEVRLLWLEPTKKKPVTVPTATEVQAYIVHIQTVYRHTVLLELIWTVWLA